MSLPPLIAALSSGNAFGAPPDDVQLVQTHISYVFLTASSVYKLKKPVRFSFLDFSTLQLRRRFCGEEVRLNRRLAIDVYRGVVGIAFDGSSARLVDEYDAAAVEYAVHMRRLPDDRRLDHLVDAGQVSAAMLDTLGSRLADFHEHAAATAEIAGNGSPDSIRRILADNYDNVARFHGQTIDAEDDDAIQSFARRFLEANDAVFRSRQNKGRIRDCHGDLHADHIYFTEPTAIVDCIEFGTQLRYCDVASDLAFLAMDIDFHGRPDHSKRIVDAYVLRSGDATLRTLLPFYKCYRAYVRGKVDSLTAVEPELDTGERQQAQASARRHFELAYRYAWSDRRALVLVSGLSGTGKSVLASALQRRLGFAVFSSDAVRKELAALAPALPEKGYDRGLYAAEHSARTYDTLLERASQSLAEGQGAIVDATFQRRRDRDAARALADRMNVELLLIECRSDEEATRQRLRDRAARGDSLSDADWQIHLEQRRRFEAFGDDEDSNRLILDTNAPLEMLVRTAVARLAKSFA